MKQSTATTLCVLSFITGLLGIIFSFIYYAVERRGEGLTVALTFGSSLMICSSAIAASIAYSAEKKNEKPSG